MQQLLFTILFLNLIQASFAQNQAGFIKEGNELFKQGNLADAIAAYNKVTENEYRYIALMNKGTALYKQKKNEDAIAAYSEAANVPNTNAVQRSGAYYNTGVVYSNQQKVAESIEAYKKALRLNSNDTQARENLQKALSELKKSGGGGEDKPQQSPSKLSKDQVQQQLNRLQQKEKNTKSRLKGNKGQLGETSGKDW